MNDRHYRKEDFVISDRIDLKNDKTFIQQVDSFIAVQQKIVFSAAVKRLQHIEETIYIEIFLPVFLCFEYFSVISLYVLIKSVERGGDVPVFANQLNV